MILLLPALLAAAPFRVAAVSDDAAYSSLMADVLTVLGGEVTAPEAIAALREKEAEARIRADEAEASRLRRNESFEELGTFLSAEDEDTGGDDAAELEVVDVSFSPEEMEFLCRGDMDAFEYLKLRENLDLLIVADVREDGLMTESRVYADAMEIHSNLYISSSDSSEFDALLTAVMPLLKSDESAIVRVDVPSTVSVAVDGESVSLIRSVIIMEKGGHTLRFTSPLYSTVEMTVDAETGLTVSPILEEIPSSRLFVSPLPYDAAIYFQGLPADSHFIGEADVPFQLTAVSPGFAPLIVQSRRPMDRIELDLRPEWMESEDVVGRAKDRFYMNMLSTIISFGCYVAAQSAAGIYTEADIAPAVTLFAGISFVQLVELFDSMFDYYQAARLGI